MIRLQIYFLNGDDPITIDCDDFEFRSNRVTNWLFVRTKDCSTRYYHIAAFRPITTTNN